VKPRPAPIRGYRVTGDVRNGLVTFRPYVYRGSRPLTPEEVAAVAAAQRAAVLAAVTRRGPKAAPAEHGSGRGYGQHRRAGTPVCEACRLAHNELTRASKARRRAVAA
jgi:hypothetical protein